MEFQPCALVYGLSTLNFAVHGVGLGVGNNFTIGPLFAAARYVTNRYWVFTRSDRQTDRSVRLVCPTGRSDDRIV